MPTRFRRPTPLEIFYLLGGLSLTVVYLWFLDDAFVYFRYVDNFVFLDLGLVYNAGEYVEGFSSPLWTLLLVALRSLGLEYPTIIQGVGAVCFLVFGFSLVAVDRRLAPSRPRVNLPLGYLAFNYAVLSYFTSGTEAPLVQVAAPLYALYILSPGSRGLQTVLGVSPMVRHELLIPLLVCAAWALYKRVRPWSMLAAAAVSLGAWGAFRVYYYADLLPNTFYLKNVTDVFQGLVYLHDTLAAYHAYALAGLAAVGAFVLRREPRLRLAERGVMLLVAATVALYVVKIGGDARHYRYLAFPFCLAVASTSGIAERVWAKYAPSAGWLAPAAVGVAIAALSFSFYPAQLDRHPATFEAQHTSLHKITDAEVHRQRTYMRLEGQSPFVTVDDLRDYRSRRGEKPYESIKVHYGCALAYIDFDKHVIHSLGLTDAILARTEMRINRPGHKMGLVELADDLAKVQALQRPPAVGMHELAVLRHVAAPWIARNLAAIEVIERKVYNRHDWRENLELALRFPDRIQP